ncbi:hypothetical protein EYZ11_002554 [Aspergillus tanneri]|uniref:Uncharacterized protein n=1 Tax=Aspergillus tanneri TaxID=1220188 RepID=A0A4V3UQ80_9EURO|nr:hypothetical protein EYZ11_002554 [Aspergillus tanneri]
MYPNAQQRKKRFVRDFASYLGMPEESVFAEICQESKMCPPIRP